MLRQTRKPAPWQFRKQACRYPHLWDRCGFFLPLWEGRGFAEALPVRRPADQKNGGSWVSTTIGSAFNIANNSDGLIWGPESNDPCALGDEWTVFFAMDFPASPGSFNRVMEWATTDSGDDRWNVYHNSGNLVWWSNSNTAGDVNLGPWPSPGYHTVVIYKVAGSDRIYAEVDGVDNGDDTANNYTSLAGLTGRRMALADSYAGIDNNAKGDYYAIGVWKDRRLIVGERRQLHDDWLGMIQEDVTQVWAARYANDLPSGNFADGTAVSQDATASGDAEIIAAPWTGRTYDSAAQYIQATASTTHAVPFPADCEPGDVVGFFYSIINPNNTTIPDFVSEYAGPGRAGASLKGTSTRAGSGKGFRHGIRFVVCDGMIEDDGWECEFTVASQLHMVAVRMPDYFRNQFQDSEIFAAFEAGSGTETGTPDPPNLNWSGQWTDEDTLVIAGAFSQASDITMTAQSPGYVDPVTFNAGLGALNSAAVHFAYSRIPSATSENPGTLTLSASDNRTWGFTVAVRKRTARSIAAPAYLVKNLDTDQVYFSLSNTTVRDIASMVKPITMAEVVRQLNSGTLDSNDITIRQESIDTGGTGQNLPLGATLTYRESGYNIIMPSSNSTAAELGATEGNRRAGNSSWADGVTRITSDMDDLRDTVGASNPQPGFANCWGLPSDNDMSCDDYFLFQKEWMNDAWIMGCLRQAYWVLSYDDGGPQTLQISHDSATSGYLHGNARGAWHTKGGVGGGSHVGRVYITPRGDRLAYIQLEGSANNSDTWDLLDQTRQNHPELFQSGPVDADGIAVSQNATASGDAEILPPANRANGTAVSQDATASGVAQIKHVATGAAQSQNATAAGDAIILEDITADGVAISQNATAFGTAQIRHFADGVAQSQNATTSSFGITGDGWTPVDTGDEETWQPVDTGL